MLTALTFAATKFKLSLKTLPWVPSLGLPPFCSSGPLKLASEEDAMCALGVQTFQLLTLTLRASLSATPQ